MWERTLTVNGFSKAYAMTGWRLGYLAAPERFAKAAATIQSNSTSGKRPCLHPPSYLLWPSTNGRLPRAGACSISQKAAVAALALGPRGGPHVAKMIEAFRERRDYVVQRLQAIPGVRLAAPQGAFYVLPDMTAFFGPGVEAKNFGPVPDCDALCRCVRL